ncbi:MAG: hypothetical protein JW850_08925 [Thermoflexales bacterium]|nr:hypothetical protein [Thermoflexales bacterium]
MNKRLNFAIGPTILLLLFVMVGLTQAQGPGTEKTSPQGEAAVAAQVVGSIPIQGRLTDTSGDPLNGTYNLTFRLYNSTAAAATPVCTDTDSVSVDNGLFNTYLSSCGEHVDGQRLHVGIEVGSDGEMSPRQTLYTVPYALSLVPGAVISATRSGANLTLRNDHAEGTGLNSSGAKYGVYGSSSTNGYGGYFWNSLDGVGLAGISVAGTGVEAASFAGTALSASSLGTAIAAGGSGIITSTADIKIAVSPLDVIADYESRSDLEFLADGPYVEVRPGASASGFEYILIPVDLPSTLFGAPTKLKSIRLCYRSDQAGSFVSTTMVGQGADSGTIDTLINDTTNRTSTDWACYTVTDATPPTITGSVYIQLTLELAGTGSAHDIRIGNITLTLTEK